MPCHVLCCAVQNTLDTRRTGSNETMLGAAQEADLAQDTNAASRPGPNQTVWQQYLGGLVMLVRPVVCHTAFPTLSMMACP